MPAQVSGAQMGLEGAGRPDASIPGRAVMALAPKAECCRVASPWPLRPLGLGRTAAAPDVASAGIQQSSSSFREIEEIVLAVGGDV